MLLQALILITLFVFSLMSVMKQKEDFNRVKQKPVGTQRKLI